MGSIGRIMSVGRDRVEEKSQRRAKNIAQMSDNGVNIVGSINHYQKNCAEEMSLRKRRKSVFDQALYLEEDYVDDPAELIDSNPDLFVHLFKEIAA